MSNKICALYVALLAFSMGITACRVPALGEEPPCGQSTLKIGDTLRQVEAIKAEPDGTLDIPSNAPETAYWVEGTNVNYVFALSPTADNRALQASLHEGAEATITWENCNTATFVLSTPQPGAPNPAVLLSQAASGITIFMPVSSGSDGFVIRGALAEETITEFNTPDVSLPQAEISLLATTASDDGQTVTLEVSILNYGEMPFTLTSADLSLVPENAAPLSLANADPALPHEINPGETAIFQLTFPRPASRAAVLNILGVEYAIEGY